METNDLIARLRWIAGAGIVNAKRDTATLMEAADRMEEMDERIAILSAEMKTREETAEYLTKEFYLPDEEKRFSGLIEED